MLDIYKTKKPPKPAVKIYPDGREVCSETKAGKDEYHRRKRVMWERQDKQCGLQISPQCPKRMPLSMATFDHTDPRGMGGARRDDRIEVDGKPQNMAVCCWCNSKKGSRRMKEGEGWE